MINLVTPTLYTVGMHVTSNSGTITFTATDNNGISTVFYSINGNARTAITGTDPEYSFNHTLPIAGINTIRLIARDNSAELNSDSIPVDLTYNKKLAATVNLSAPANNATEVPVLTPFTWTALTDDDSIFYVVKYSTSLDLSGATITSEVTTKALTIGAGDILTNSTHYYYQVIGYTKSPYQDTAVSGIRNFYTVNQKPTTTLYSC